MNGQNFNRGEIIAVPGLGGRSNVFKQYAKHFPEYDFYPIDLIDWRETERKISSILDLGKPTVMLCSCYGGQIAIRLSIKYPNIKAMVITEPFFAEFTWWRKAALAVVKAFLAILPLTSKLGLKREKFPEIDYENVETWPVFLQPIFDMRHQKLSDYYEKVKDILTFNLPKNISVPTLFIFSSEGFTRDPDRRRALQAFFVKSDIVELSQKSHNIVTLAPAEIAEAVSVWVNNLHN